MKVEFDPLIISLFDYTGIWSKPYRMAGYRVIQIDTKLGHDIMDWNFRVLGKDSVRGILAAPPCTDFSVSGSQYWKIKDRDGRTGRSLALVRRSLEIIDHFQPDFHAIENPVGRLPRLLPRIGKPWYFQPCQFGDPWTKRTGLWGKFHKPEQSPVEPNTYCSQGSWIQRLGGRSERTKELRSITPPGFAIAFFRSNNPCGLSLPEGFNRENMLDTKVFDSRQ